MNKSNKEKRVFIYCRESRDDYGENYERIETQRDLLLKYCKTHGYTNIVGVIMDDDKSGTDFSRFKDIRNKAKNKEIDVIVFKNSARLGRNQKEALDFVEYLEENNVEIIFEDEQYNEEMFGLYAWFNERRARDDSKNIRRNLRHKIEEGQLLVKAIYGYEKEGNNLVINKETAKIVKEIYEKYYNGWRYKKIAEYLNRKQIPTPSKSRNFKNARKAEKWNSQHIMRILNDRRYIGDYIGGYTEKVSFKSKKTRIKEKDKWVIISNHHEKIIDKELFEKVQEIIKENKRKEKTYKTSNKTSKDNIYSGLIYCGKCKNEMYKRIGKNRPDSYICKKYSREGKIKENYGCLAHRIRIEYLNNIVNKYISDLIDNPKFIKFALNNIHIESSNKEIIENKINRMNYELEKSKKQYKQIYEDKLNELIPEFVYIEKKNELEKQIEYTKKKILEEKNKLSDLVNMGNRAELILKVIKNIKENGLTREEVFRLFDKIIIFESKEITKHEKDLYNLNDMLYNKLYEKGGLVFCLKNMYP